MIQALDLAAVNVLGRRLAGTLPTGAVVWLEGDLGAGKTTLAQAIVQARVGPGAGATSPTFSLAQHYPGAAGPVHHVDCYRLRHQDEAAELDWEGMLAGDLLLVEWPERGGVWVPRPTVRVRLAHLDRDDMRSVMVAPALDGEPA